VNLPGFDGSSFASYPTVEDALFSLQIQITFLAQNVNDSLLLYDAFNSQGTSDFFAIVIKDGYLEFRYELGSGRWIRFMKLSGSIAVRRKPYILYATFYQTLIQS